MSETPTFLARLTSPGKSAIATLGLTGPNAWKMVHTTLRARAKAGLPDFPEQGAIFLGRLGEGAGDEVVVSVPSLQPLVVEVHPHGGVEVVRMLLAFLASKGAIQVGWQEFLKAIHPDPVHALALIQINQCHLQGPTEILLDQVEGAFQSWLASWLQLVHSGQSFLARTQLCRLLQWAPLSAHLSSPWKVVIAGKTNAGKSSLMNRIAGFERSIVSPIEGTTRDVLWLQTAIEGWPFAFADTAGFRETSDFLETGGMRLGKVALEDADLCLWVEDATATDAGPGNWALPVRTLRVINKIDLCPQKAIPEGMFPVSALNGMGIEELLLGIFRALIPNVPEAGAPFPFHPELLNALESSLACIDNDQLGEVHQLWKPWLALHSEREIL